MPHTATTSTPPGLLPDAAPGQTAVLTQQQHPDVQVTVVCTRRGVWTAHRDHAAGTPTQWQTAGWAFDRLLPVTHDLPGRGTR